MPRHQGDRKEQRLRANQRSGYQSLTCTRKHTARSNPMATRCEYLLGLIDGQPKKRQWVQTLTFYMVTELKRA